MTTQLNNFKFTAQGYGHYNVTYTSLKTNKTWSIVTDDMHLIDATKNADEPKQLDLKRLKNICKGN